VNGMITIVIVQARATSAKMLGCYSTQKYSGRVSEVTGERRRETPDTDVDKGEQRRTGERGGTVAVGWMMHKPGIATPAGIRQA